MEKHGKPHQQKAHDLAWYEYETRLRKVVHELLEPSVKRSREDREMHDVLHRKYDELTKRLEDIEYAIQKSDKRQTVFEDIYKKITDLDTDRQQQELELLNKIQYNQKQIEELATSYKGMDVNLSAMDERTIKILEDLEEAMKNMTKFKEGTTKLVDEIHQDSLKSAEKLKEFDIKVEEQFQRVTSGLTDVRAYTQNHEISISSLKTHVSEMQGKIASFDRNLKDCNLTIKNFGQHIDSIKSLKFKIENFELQIRTSENYLEKYLPLYTQSQISEALHSCLSTTNKRRLILFEERKFRDLNNDILQDDGNPNIQRRVEKVYEILEPTIKRYTRGFVAQNMGIKTAQDGSTDKSARKTENEVTPGQTNRKLESERTDSTSNLGEPEDGEKKSDEKRSELPSPLKTQDRHQSTHSPRPQTPQLKGVEQTQSTQKTDEDHKESQFKKMSAQNRGGQGQPIHRDHDDEDEESDDDDGNNFYVKPKEFRRLQAEVYNIRDEADKNLLRLKNDVFKIDEKFSMGQDELSENANMMIRNTINEVETMIERIKKDRTDNMMEFSDFEVKLNRQSLFGEKTFQFLKRMSDSITPLIECVNGLLAIVLKEEKEKKTLYHLLSNSATMSQYNMTGDEFGRKYSAQSQKTKKAFDLPYLPGQKLHPDSDTDRARETATEIKFKHNGQTITKLEFLEITYEAFKPSLGFASKFRMTPNFNQFFEGDFVKPPGNNFSTPNKRLSTDEGSPFRSEKIKTDEGEEDMRRDKVDVPFSKANAFAYRNYKYGMPESRAINVKNRFYSRNQQDKGSMNRTFY